MSARLAHICRHPVKSIGWETLEQVRLAPDQVLPFDRRWALAHEAAGFDDRPQGWRPKRDFVRGVASAPLMAVRARLEEDTGRLHLTHPERPPLALDLDSQTGSDVLVDWISPLWPNTRPAPSHLVSLGTAQALTDVEPPFVAILNLATQAELAAHLGQDLSIHRWRGNLWLDGLAPSVERDWIGQEIQIGDTRLCIEEPITRCRATEGNPETGLPDANTLGGLKALYGHQDFGVYARVLSGGEIRVNDAVVTP
ncbi:MAG: MOSC domain-containing protein [Mangrovicoccus sp.]|nr:MOSC domain-containing protein [Mangrovicoccus sp.]